MFFFTILQLVIAALVVALVLCQNSEDSVSGMVLHKSGSFSSVKPMSFLCKLTWACVFIFFLNTILLGAMYSSKRSVNKIERESREEVVLWQEDDQRSE